jgi:hypothetical protein
MAIEPNQHDEAVDKVFAAIRDAAAPEGMEARILQSLHQRASAASRQPASYAFTSAWWGGAFTGAAAATLAAVLFLFASHFRSHSPLSDRTNSAAAYNVAPRAVVTPASSVPRDTMRTPCTRPAVLPLRPVPPTAAVRPLVADTRLESAAPSLPAPALPLTAEERGLVQLVHTADPKTLATLTPETKAKLQAQEAAEFDKFFSPKPPHPTSETHE